MEKSLATEGAGAGQFGWNVAPAGHAQGTAAVCHQQRFVERLGKKPKTASQSSSRSWADQTEEEADWDRESQDECQGLETKREPEPAKETKLEKLNKLWSDKAAERKITARS